MSVELRLCDESVDDLASAKQGRLLPFAPYQRGDSGVPLHLNKLQSSKSIVILEVDVTVRSKEMLLDERMTLCDRDVERCGVHSRMLPFVVSPFRVSSQSCFRPSTVESEDAVADYIEISNGIIYNQQRYLRCAQAASTGGASFNNDLITL